MQISTCAVQWIWIGTFGLKLNVNLWVGLKVNVNLWVCTHSTCIHISEFFKQEKVEFVVPSKIRTRQQCSSVSLIHFDLQLDFQCVTGQFHQQIVLALPTENMHIKVN